ncbi:peptidase S41-like protein [Luteimonas cucumeris]|uniref:Peptidase S41-like protein n=1 Tax=Luteimonas cucumeris TaxID=985012 RepID=A0A562LAU2_9GAMM|nr:S41 family peptidase [Luteimonas cucumeris]TWI04789.1 peptidase S41-like protein [Luteimonas cucumeris]
MKYADAINRPPPRQRHPLRWLKRTALAIIALLLLALAWDVLSYDADAWLADYSRLKQDMAQGYANLDWMVEKRGVDLPALDRRTTDALRNAHSNLRAFIALRSFVRGFNDPHLRMKPGARPASATARTSGSQAVATSEEADPAAADCVAAGHEEGDHAFRFPFARVAGWKPIRNGDFPTGMIGDTGVLRIAQFGEDRYLDACQAVFKPGIGRHALKLAVRAHQQALLRDAIDELQAKGARRLLVDVSGNGGGTEWVTEVVALISERELSRREALLVAPACDRAVVWAGNSAPCPVFASTGTERVTLQGSGEWRGPVLILADSRTGSAAEGFVAWLQQNKVATVIGERTAGAGCGYVDGGNPTRLKVVPVDVWMPNCARFLDDGRNEIDGIAPDIALPMRRDADADVQAEALARVLKESA